MAHPLRFMGGLVHASFEKWLDDQCPRYGASLSYYMVLSLAPLLVIMVGVIGFFSGQGAAHAQLVGEATLLAGEKAGMVVDALLQATQRLEEGATASLVALALLLIGATGVLVELRHALDHIWMTPPVLQTKASLYGSIRHAIWSRILAFVVLVAIGGMMVIAVFVSTYLAVLSRWMQSYTGALPQGMRIANLLFSYFLQTLLFSMLMLGLPSKRPPWRMVLPGALVSVLLFNVGKSLISLYLAHTVTTSVYGAAGSLVALMIWVYYSSLMVLLGAEVAWVLYSTPKGELPGSAAYQRIYHAAFIARQRQIYLQERAVHHADKANDADA